MSLARLVWLGIRSNDALAQRLGWTSLVAIVYLAVHQLVDFYPNMAAIGFLFALLIARLDALTPAEPPWSGVLLTAARPVMGGKAAVAVLAVATVVSFGWLLRSERAALDGQQATDAANDGDWAGALVAARRAVAADPDMPPYLFTQGLSAAHEGQLEEALAAMRRAAEIDDFPTAWLDVAQLELERGDDDAARDALGRAMRIGFQNPQVAYGAMTIYEALGDREAAVSAAADALVAAPGLASDPSWSSTADLPRRVRSGSPRSARTGRARDRLPGRDGGGPQGGGSADRGEHVRRGSRGRGSRHRRDGSATRIRSTSSSESPQRTRCTTCTSPRADGSPRGPTNQIGRTPGRGTAMARGRSSTKQSGSAHANRSRDTTRPERYMAPSSTSTGASSPNDEVVPGMPHLRSVFGVSGDPAGDAVGG